MLRTVIATAALLFAATTWAAEGPAVYKTNCAKCHGDTGKADSPVAKAMKVPALAGDEKVASMSDADVVTRIKTNQKHAAFIKSLSDDDVTAVAAYVKSLAAAK